MSENAALVRRRDLVTSQLKQALLVVNDEKNRLRLIEPVVCESERCSQTLGRHLGTSRLGELP